MFFFAVAFLGTMVLWAIDTAANGSMNLTPKAREQRQQAILYVLKTEEL